MAINLVKGQKIDLGLSKVLIGLGWTPNESENGPGFDLDVSAFMLNSNKKTPTDDFFVFYCSERRVLPTKLDQLEPYSSSKYPDYEEDYRTKTRPVSPDWAVIGSIDDKTGSASDGGDDETLDVDLSKIDPQIHEIIIVVSIYDAEKRRQNFGQGADSYIRILDARNKNEICKYELGEDFSVETCIEFGRLYKRNDVWRFEAMGVGYKGGLEALLNKYS